jgi:hypothetical protein
MNELELPFPVPMMHHAPGSHSENVICLNSKYSVGFQEEKCGLKLIIIDKPRAITYSYHF